MYRISTFLQYLSVLISIKSCYKILETAKKIQAELIVIGSRNPGMKTYLLGSTASSVVSYAESSVLVVG
ncbi:universal stress protein [Proteus vulgaris]|uniref:universal stress protein n=1 Tax=Proteus vulgaris TaxID=585 RepID=UPI0034DD5B18